MMETMGKPDKNIDETVKHICDAVHKRIYEAYQRGLEEGKQTAVGAAELREKLEYQRGLDDAWEAAKKLSWAEKYGGYGDRLDEVFDRTDTFDFLEYSPNEAIAKLKAYEEQNTADDIKVGDVVFLIECGMKYIVTSVDCEDESCIIMSKNGGFIKAYKCELHKTGKHINIEKILEAIKE